jgi:hypothetical protein
MGDDGMPTRMLNNKMESNRGRGRPHNTWMQDVQEDLEAMKIRKKNNPTEIVNHDIWQ